MSLLSRLMLLVLLAMLPAMAIEIYNQVELRRERETELRDQAVRLLTLAEAEQKRLVDGVHQLLLTLGQIDTIIGFDPDRCQEFLGRLDRRYPDHLSLRIADRAGIVRCATEPEMVGLDISTRDYFRNALRTSDFVPGGYVRERAGSEPLRPFALAFRDRSGETAGVITALVDLSWINSLLALQSMASDGVLTITDRKGIVLARVPESPDWIGRQLPKPYLTLLDQEDRGTAFLEAEDGRRHLLAYSPPGTGPDDSFVAVSLDWRQALAPIDMATSRALLLIGGSLLLALLLAWWGGHRFVREPILQIVEATRRWGAGDFGARVRLPGGGSELALLGRAFNAMAEALEDRAQAREMAHALEHKMAAVLESVTDMVLEVDREWRFTFLNERGRAEIARGRELIGRRLDEIFPEVWDNEFGDQFRHAMAEHVPVAFEAYHPTLEAWYTVRAFPSREGLAVYFQNISERRELEESLRRSQQLLDRMLETLPVGILVIDQNGRVVRVNPAMRRIWGGQSLADFQALPAFKGWWAETGKPLRPEDWAAVRAIRDGNISLGEVIEIEAFDGARKTIMNSALPLRNDQGCIIGAIAVNEDITERRQAEVELRAARDQAERANAAKSKFLAAASHDLRQPIQSLFLFAAALAPYLAGERPREIHAQLEHGLESLKGLLDSLLDVSRLDAGQIAPRIEAFAIDSLLGQIDAGYAPIATAKGLSWTMAPCGRAVRSDRTLLGRMLRNLVENAIRYTVEGGIAVTCRPEGESLWIEVADTGIGIPAEHLQEVFAEFVQLGNPERDRQLGLGLGLAIVRRLSRLLGHRVVVDSTPGRGSVFAIEVPLAPAAMPDPEVEGGHQPAGRNRLVVVVDDDAMVLMALETVLKDWGYRVVSAASEEDALKQLRGTGSRPDVIIADYRLRGGKVGTDAIQSLRLLCGEAVPGVVLTGETGPDVLRRVAEQGFGVVHKPVTPHQLSTILAKLAGVAEVKDLRPETSA